MVYPGKREGTGTVMETYILLIVLFANFRCSHSSTNRRPQGLIRRTTLALPFSGQQQETDPVRTHPQAEVVFQTHQGNVAR